MGIEISKLPEAEALDMEEELVVVQNGVTKKAKARNMLTNIDKDISQINKNIEKINKTLNTQNTDIKNINTSISNIKDEQVIQNTDIDKSKEEIEHLKKYINVLPYNEAEGKIVSIKDSANVPVLAVGASGYSEQATRSGKNLLNIPKEYTFTSMTTKVFKASAGSYKVTCLSETHSGKTNPVIVFVDNNVVVSIYKSMNTEVSLEKDETTIRIYSNGYSYGDSEGIEATINELMISKNGGEYEEYGAMPSPDFPSEIRNLGDDINLFDVNGDLDSNYKNFYAKETIENSNIGGNIFGHYSNNIRCKAYYTIKAGQKRVFQIFDSLFKFQIVRYANQEGIIEDTATFIGDEHRTCEYTATKDGYIFLSLQKTDNSSFTDEEVEKLKNSIKVCERVATRYSPYGYGSFEITHAHHNLLKPTWAQELLDRCGVTSSSVSGIKNIDGYRYLQYLASLGNNTGLNYFIKDCFKESTQYTFKCVLMRSDQYLDVNIRFKYTDGTTYKENLKQSSEMVRTEYKFSSQANKTVENIGISYNTGSTYIDLDKCMLYEGTEDLDWEGYADSMVFPTKPLHEDDYLASNGTHMKRETIIYTGKENWSKRSGNNHTFALTLPKISLKGLCSHYKSLEASSNIDKKDGYYLASSATVIITDMRFSTVKEFKTYLSEEYDKGTPVTVEYEFAKEEIIPYTPEQQEAWDKLQKLMMYDTTHFISDANLKIKYVKDINKEHQQLQAQIDEIKELLSPTATSAMLLDNLEKDLVKEV